MSIDGYYIPNDFMAITLYWTWDEFKTYALPRTEWSNFLKCYETGVKLYKFKNYNQGSNIPNGGEIVDLTKVIRIQYY